MSTTAFEGFKQNGSVIPVKDTTARTSISAIEEKIPSGASSSNKLATASDVAAKISSTEKGTNNGVATLGNDGRVPTSQLPSYVDDVLEYASTSAFPTEGEAGKIYVALDTNKTYRWGGSEYVEISESIALGETQGTAYEGSKGKANADNITNIQAVIPSDATPSNKLATASDVTAVSDAVSAIKDGTDIDSFSDVESALGDVDTAINGIKDGTDIDSFSDVESALSNKVDKVSGKGLSTNDYDNTAKGVVDNIQDNVKANTKLIKDTVGWSGKNKIKGTNTGQTGFAVSNGVITVNTTASSGTLWFLFSDGGVVLKAGKYIVNGLPSTGSGTTFGFFIRKHGTSSGQDILTNETEITISEDGIYDFLIPIRNGYTATNLVFKPMIRDADILDSTFEPYFGSTAFPRSEQAVLGAKNLCPNTGVTTEHNNVTFTVNADGSISTSGTATGGRAKLVYTIYYHGPNNPKLTGCPENGGDNYWIDLYDYNTNQHNNEYGTGSITTIQDGDKIDVNINIKEGFNATGLVFKPMLSIDGGEYAPYAMTNKELTENVVGMYIPKILTSSNDIDDIKTNGWYEWEGTIPTNSPIQGWAKMRVLGDKSNTRIQVVINVNQIFIRRFGGNPASWGNWFKFQGTEVTS